MANYRFPRIIFTYPNPCRFLATLPPILSNPNRPTDFVSILDPALLERYGVPKASPHIMSRVDPKTEGPRGRMHAGVRGALNSQHLVGYNNNEVWGYINAVVRGYINAVVRGY